MRIFHLAAALVGLTFAAATAALAQDTTVSAEPWVAILLPFVLTVTTALIGAGTTFGIAYLNARWNIQIDAENRAAFQTAVTNAAGLLIQKAGSKAAAAAIDVGSPMLKDAIRYVEKGAPAALARQGITPEHVAKAILAKIPQIEAKGPVPFKVSGNSVSP